MKRNLIKTKKSVFFARLKKWAACLWPTSLPRVALRSFVRRRAKWGGRRQILRLSLLKKQGLSSTPSRAKTVLIRVEKIISVANKKSVKLVRLWRNL
jgi:hypothetical protein